MFEENSLFRQPVHALREEKQQNITGRHFKRARHVTEILLGQYAVRKASVLRKTLRNIPDSVVPVACSPLVENSDAKEGENCLTP